MDEKLADLMRQILVEHDRLKAIPRPPGGGLLGGLLQQLFAQLLPLILNQVGPALLNQLGPLLQQLLQQWLGKIGPPATPPPIKTV